MAPDVLASFSRWLHSVFIDQLDIWVVVGLLAQFLFTMRFVVQWIASERARRSVVPAAFWTFSILGGSMLLVYAIYREDPVFILGQAAGLFIYLRNIWFIRREKREANGAPVVS
ncbi:lipid-A-disaccharide synthase N-terminal domain-containing protein [Prosthecomicrobium pneumaticum]|uniref:Lipid-A-disaccharide synthase-like uncharacterized protein n=1 Tax=Prosthecomicrobium pneumaticum TaxID=81895 RepID=A0A7W9FQF5_9HYPH|nr:lipid-A-disaccharide synthase N-terminal domain-containing protein [Prosthecomicrobium pneumaticum]MBB5754871.1 lipid-A-disaccharide synthase-like uncharacterized protein [Prosthecomicrobium pneumaticum]